MIQKALVPGLLCLLSNQSVNGTALSKTEACSYETEQVAQICPRDSFLFAGQWLRNEGQYSATFQDANGCDSIVHLQLWTLPTSKYEFQTYLCEGETLNYPGYTITHGGIYRINYTSSWGCDSTLIIHVQELQNTTHQVNKQICEGDSFFFGNEWLRTDGNYQALFARSQACDSIVNLNLTVIRTRVPVTRESDGLLVAVPMDAYQWMVCPMYFPIPNATKAKLPVTSSGTYSLRVVNKGCVDTLDCIYYNRNALKVESPNEWNLMVYPNPATDKLQVYGEYTGNARVTLYTGTGTLVFTGEAKSRETLSIPVRELAPGLYFLRIDTESGSHTQRVSVQ